MREEEKRERANCLDIDEFIKGDEETIWSVDVSLRP
jgi:hypothetical protein